MLNASESVILGVVSGILTSLVIWLAISIFKKNVIPWYQGLVYKGVDIGGEWVGFWGKDDLSFEDSTQSSKKNIKDPDFRISIYQRGHDVDGIFSVLKHPSGSRDTKMLLVQGVFKDGNLILIYKPKDRTRLGSGSAVMKLVRDGKIFEGKWLFINSVDGEVVDRVVYLNRENI